MKGSTCASCGGPLRAQRITIDRRIDGRLVVFEDVPARVCADCSNVWLDHDVLKAMEDALSGGDNDCRTIEVPAYSLKDRAA